MKLPLVPSGRFVAFARVALVLLVCAGGCSRKAASAPAQPSTASQPTEQRWIIGSITADLANLADFAAGSEHWTPLPADAVDVRESAGGEPGQSYALAVRLPGGGEPVRSDLKITASVWSPELYVPTLHGVFERLKLSLPAGNDPGGTLPDADLLKALASPLTAGIEAQNQRLSGWLQEHPLDARAHEQAALLLGTLAMRENSGLFWNPRGLCNRATAHLALARALRPEVSECGEVAELLIGLIIDTKADCQKRIAALQAQVAAHPELGPWVAAAALRNTRDYRLLPNPQNATLLERIEFFRAASEAISGDEAIKRLGDFQPANAPDWERVVLETGITVGSGRAFALPSIGLEMKDAALVFPELQTARAPGQLAAVLNLPPGSAVQAGEGPAHAQVRIIDPGTWAQFFQRHLLQAADQTYNLLRYMWGVTDQAESMRVQTASMLRRLTLYPLCLGLLGKEDGSSLYPLAADVLNQHPEWVGDGAWADVVKTVPAQYAAGGSWAAVSGGWFSPRLPVGTVYGFDWRTNAGNVLPRPTAAEFQRAYEIAPLKYDVCRLYVYSQAPHHHPTAEQLQQGMEPLMTYYLRAMWGVAWLVRDDPARYGEMLHRAAALDPSYYLSLGKYDVEHRLEPEAAQAYQAAIDQGANAVMVANESSWLVNYYYDHGQPERALSVARMAAEVYSSRGLQTMAALLERMGRVKEAESYYEKVNERYHEAKPLHEFYARAAGAHPEYADKMKAVAGDLFPGGIEEVTLAQLSDKPARGVLVHGENDLSRQAGLKPGAIVVAIDGKRVNNMEQYSFVRALTASPGIDLLVYQDGGYQAIHAQVPGRMFNLVFTSWP